MHHCAHFIQHIIRNIKFCFGVQYGQASCFIENKCIIQRFCNLFNCIIDLFLYGLDQFLAFHEEVSIPSKALLLKIFGFFFFLNYLIFTLPFHVFRQENGFSLVVFVKLIHRRKFFLYLFLPLNREFIQHIQRILVFRDVLKDIVRIDKSIFLCHGNCNYR